MTDGQDQDPKGQAERLRWAMRRGGVKSGRSLGEKANLSASYMSLLLRGKRRLGGDSAASLATILGVDPGWLLTGRGPAPGGYAPQNADPYPKREQAISLLQGLIAHQVVLALRQEVPDGDWALERWVDRAKELQRLYEAVKAELER